MTGSASVLLSVLDWTVVAVYVGGLVVMGLLLSRRHFAPVDFFLASRATQWPVIGLALLASNMSSTALVGLAGGAYALGLSVYDYEWTATVILVFFCLFLLPFVIRSGTYTMPEFLERRYDARVRLLFALLTLFLNVFVDSAGILYSGSLVCQLLFPEQPLWLIVLVLACAGARRRKLKLRNAAHPTHRRFLARPSFLERARPEHRVLATPVDDHYRVGHEEAGAIQDVGVVIGLPEEQDWPVVTHGS